MMRNFFRQLNNARKQKSAVFLRDKCTRFNLLMTLTTASILSPVTTLLFQTSNARTTKDYQPTKTSSDKKRRRLRFKAQGRLFAADAAEASAPKVPTFSSVATAAATALSCFWQCLNEQQDEDLFQVARAYWPEDFACLRHAQAAHG